MPRSVVDTLYTGTEWLASTAGPPLRATYDFLFPPLDELLDDAHPNGAVGWRSDASHRPSYDRTSTRRYAQDDELERVEAWEGFGDSPWSFVTSRYALALAVVAIVNNRVQHICRPRGGARHRLSPLQRLALRLPSLVLLARAVLILTTVVVDAFLAPSNPLYVVLTKTTTTAWRDTWLAHTPVDGWARDRFGTSSRDALLRARDAAAFWAAFTSTCVAVVSNTMVRNLDADREEPPAFNLVGFAFLLHFHSFSPDAPANEHVYLCVLLQLLQLFAISLSRCRRPVLAPRLLISGIFGIASLAHYAVAASTGRYPVLEALSRAPEIALVLIVALTMALHATTMLLLEGSVEWHRLLFSRSNLPAMDEDWSMALFKLGTACMESTRLTGMERQADDLVVLNAPYLELSTTGNLELVHPLHTASNPATSGAASYATQGGLGLEVKEVRFEAGAPRAASWSLRHAGLGRLRALLEFVGATLLVLRSIAAMAASKALRCVGYEPVVPGWVYRLLRLARLAWHGTNGETRREARQAMQAQEQRQRREARRTRVAAPTLAAQRGWMESRTDTDVAAQGGLGAERVGGWQDEEEDDDFCGSEEGDTDSVAAGSDVDVDEVGADEVSLLLAELNSHDDEGDMSRQVATGNEAFQRLLLAHLTRPSASPLTRSRYTALLPANLDDARLATALLDRRPASNGVRAVRPDEARRLCVVCCTEERNVICWPCRCLALCMDCREHLASQPPSRSTLSTHQTHLCPTCRTPVHAFSRLYIP